jgi:hypothetical protein
MPNRRGLSEKLGIAAAITCITIAGTGLSLGLLLISFVLDARGVSGLTIGLIATMGGLATVIVSTGCGESNQQRLHRRLP